VATSLRVLEVGAAVVGAAVVGAAVVGAAAAVAEEEAVAVMLHLC
jgi:hypothetical protein